MFDPQRVLLEANVNAPSNISLGQVFAAIASNDGQNGDPDRLFQEIYDSYATADQAILPDAIHCGDETTDGVPTLNGFPIECNRIERIHVNDLFSFFPTAFVNRLDLAPCERCPLRSATHDFREQLPRSRVHHPGSSDPEPTTGPRGPGLRTARSVLARSERDRRSVHAREEARGGLPLRIS